MSPQPHRADLRRPSPTRRWGYRCAAVLLALTPFLIAELYLQATRSVDSSDLSEDPIFETGKTTRLFVPDDRGEEMQIPPTRWNFFRPQSFAVEKPVGTRRLFVLGGSTVQGRPYATETAFPKWLQLRLEAADPTHRYEVINCGGVSYASYRLALILQEVLAYQPDGIVIYTGHNEFLEERSYGSANIRDSLLQRLSQRSELVKLLRDRLSNSGQSNSGLSNSDTSAKQTLAAEVDTRLDQVDGLDRYVRDPQWRRGVVQHFRDSLGRMIRGCQTAGVPVWVCMPASECVETPPIKIASLPMGKDAEQSFRDAWTTACDSAATTQARLAACERCLQRDPYHAGAHFVAGRLCLSLRRYEQAKNHLIAARDHDVCPLRATTPLLEVIEELTRAASVPLIRADRVLDRRDLARRPLPDGLCDSNRFEDHIHPTVTGHQEIAEALASAVLAEFGVTAPETYEADYRVAATKHLGQLDEAYFIRGEQRLQGLLNWAKGRAGRLSIEPLPEATP